MPPPRVHLPVWPFWIAGAACEAVCRPLGIEPPLYRRRVDFFTKSRAFRIDRARRELGLRAGGGPARGHPAHAGVVQGAGMAIGSADIGDQRPRDQTAGDRAAIGVAARDRGCGGASRDLARAGRSVSARRLGPREVPGARRRTAGYRGAGAARARHDDRAVRARARWGCCCGSCSIRGCSGPAGATSCSASTSCCATRTRSASATTW